mmetsp:Transcript_18674/g.60903  ORF Transcript_18674/g.60903 Transcript_18674/m.60903 type:complete len:240 (+) Transcript_18674:3079-3798(+)
MAVRGGAHAYRALVAPFKRTPGKRDGLSARGGGVLFAAVRTRARAVHSQTRALERIRSVFPPFCAVRSRGGARARSHFGTVEDRVAAPGTRSAHRSVHSYRAIPDPSHHSLACTSSTAVRAQTSFAHRRGSHARGCAALVARALCAERGRSAIIGGGQDLARSALSHGGWRASHHRALADGGRRARCARGASQRRAEVLPRAHRQSQGEGCHSGVGQQSVRALAVAVAWLRQHGWRRRG